MTIWSSLYSFISKIQKLPQNFDKKGGDLLTLVHNERHDLLFFNTFLEKIFLYIVLQLPLAGLVSCGRQPEKFIER